MKKIIVIATAIVAMSGLTACGGLNSVLAKRQETIEIYHIFDIKTGITPDAIVKAAADGLARNTNSVVQHRPLQMNVKIPQKPSRFELTKVSDALGPGMGGVMIAFAGGGASAEMRIAQCKDALWTSKAIRDIPGSSNLTLYSCLYRYTSGYQLDVYAVFMKASGGLTGVLTDATGLVIGTPEHWVSKTIIETVRSIELAANSKMTRIEGQPELAEYPVLAIQDTAEPAIVAQSPQKSKSREPTIGRPVDWTQLFKSWEDGCARSPEFESFEKQFVFYDDKQLRMKFGKVDLSSHYETATGAPTSSDMGEYTNYTLPVTAGTYYGIPVKAIQFYIGNENGIGGMQLLFNASEKDVKKALKKKKVSFKKKDDMQAMVSGDKKQASLTCDHSN